MQAAVPRAVQTSQLLQTSAVLHLKVAVSCAYPSCLDTPSNPTPVGPIAGCVVGIIALAALCLGLSLGLALFYLRRRHRARPSEERMDHTTVQPFCLPATSPPAGYESPRASVLRTYSIAATSAHATVGRTPSIMMLQVYSQGAEPVTQVANNSGLACEASVGSLGPPPAYTTRTPSPPTDVDFLQG